MSEEDAFNKEAANTIISLLKSNVPKSDAPNIQNELKQNFVLGKIKSNVKKKKPKKKKQCLTRREKQRLGFYKILRNSIKYDDVMLMNRLWTGYMEQLLELDKPIPVCFSKNWETFTQSIYKADFHGSILKVIRSKCPSYVGKMGICIMDTKNTFKIVSKENLVTTLPKIENVFELHLKNMRITLFGKHMSIRPAERSTKKFKGHCYPDL